MKKKSKEVSPAARGDSSDSGKSSFLGLKKAAKNLRRRRTRQSSHHLREFEYGAVSSFGARETEATAFSATRSSSPPAPSSGDSSENDVVAGSDKARGGGIGGGGHSGNVTCWSHGSVSVIGRRSEMEDAVAAKPGFVPGEYDFFGIYDGHGGARVAEACRVGLHRLLGEEIGGEENGGGIDWERAMRDCFRKMDEEVNGEIGGYGETAEEAKAVTMGSTAVVAVVGKEKVVVANCGDSRAVLCRGGVALALSNDHKPGRPDELKRIEAAGGKVINWNGDRVLGVLATSRSIGDQYLKPFVTSEPEVMVTERNDGDEFIILASDGLWDVVSNEVACKVVRRRLNSRAGATQLEILSCKKNYNEQTQCHGRAAQAAALLAELAVIRGSKDNISVIVIELKKPSAGANFPVY